MEGAQFTGTGQIGSYTSMPLPVGQLFIDTSYQRTEDAAHLKKLINNWADELSGCLEVNRRRDGVYAVFDGGHRTRAARHLFGDDHRLLCKVFEGLPVEQEASMFVNLNQHRKPIKTQARFKAGLKANDPEWVGIAAVLTRLDVLFSPDQRVSGDRAVNCHKALRDVYTHKSGGTEMVEKTLRLLLSIWNGSAVTLEAPWISGMADFIRVYCWMPHFEEQKIIERLSPYKIEDVVTRHIAYRAAGVPVSRAYRKAFQEFYNKGLRAGKLLTKAEAEE